MLNDEKPLQAVVLADSFNERFMPLTLDRPRCLLPLVNVPILEYTFEFLAISGVEEVILFCRNHSDQIRQYINDSRWVNSSSSMQIQIVTNTDCTSVGDALRDIDSRSIIHGDFVLTRGDLVSNIDLKFAIENFKAINKKDKNFIMSMVLKKTDPFHRSRERNENGVFVIDSSDPKVSECIAYESLISDDVSSVSLPMSPKIENAAKFDVRFDLLDCQIDICSLNVLALYTENFDYQNPRVDFLKGILTSDILGVRVATNIVDRKYAARIRSPHLYDSVSKDIIERWVFPIVPETDLLNQEPFSYRRGNIYISDKSQLNRTSYVSSNSVICGGVRIGDGSSIECSVVGKNCHIGANVKINNSYIWDNCRIEDGCILDHCIVADNVVIKTLSNVRNGCIIASNISVGPNANLPPCTRVAKLGEHIDLGALRNLSISPGEIDHSEIFKELTAQHEFLGNLTDGVVWKGSIDGAFKDDQEEYEAYPSNDLLAAFEIGGAFHDTLPVYPDPITEDEEADELQVPFHSKLGNHDDFDFSNESHLGVDCGVGRNIGKFNSNAFDLLRHAIETEYEIDNALLEINGLKFSCNATFSECRQVIIKAICSFINVDDPSNSIDKLFEKWSPLLARFTQGPTEQRELIEFVQSDICIDSFPISNQKKDNIDLLRTFQFIIPVLYKVDIIDDPSVIEWFHSIDDPDSIYLKQVQGFVGWLGQEDDSEVSSEEDDMIADFIGENCINGEAGLFHTDLDTNGGFDDEFSE